MIVGNPFGSVSASFSTRKSTEEIGLECSSCGQAFNQKPVWSQGKLHTQKGLWTRTTQRGSAKASLTSFNTGCSETPDVQTEKGLRSQGTCCPWSPHPVFPPGAYAPQRGSLIFKEGNLRIELLTVHFLHFLRFSGPHLQYINRYCDIFIHFSSLTCFQTLFAIFSYCFILFLTIS